MSTPHVQLRDDPPRISCWETFRYACSSDYKKYLQDIGWILFVIVCLAFGYGLGVLAMWGVTGTSPSEMDTEDFIGSIFLGVVVSIIVIGVVGLCGACIYHSIICCRGYYATKKAELEKRNSENTPGFVV